MAVRIRTIDFCLCSDINSSRSASVIVQYRRQPPDQVPFTSRNHTLANLVHASATVVESVYRDRFVVWL